MYRFVVKPEAELDILEAAQWYESRVNGLGHIFLNSIEAVFDTIKLNPRIFEKKHKEIRRGLTRKFPYAVYNIIEESAIFILAVIHYKRDPGFHLGKISGQEKKTIIGGAA